ncbi:MAG: hypothetical protein COC15_01590 [Legionellales bacterium]|nr:MAG: hypothetical protein COC15_01590 [Legionellales bacterium]
MSANDNLSYGDYGYNHSGSANNYSNFTDAEYSADPYSTKNIYGDGDFVDKQPFSPGNISFLDCIKEMWYGS